MPVIIKCRGVAGPFKTNATGLFLKDCDFEFSNGRGQAVFTNDVRQAMKFATMQAALAYWQTQSRTVPMRPDGKPNRPLTGYHMEFANESDDPDDWMSDCDDPAREDFE